MVILLKIEIVDKRKKAFVVNVFLFSSFLWEIFKTATNKNRLAAEATLSQPVFYLVTTFQSLILT